MKKIFYLTLAALALLSCTLERENYTEIYPETTFKTATDLELAVNGLYYYFNMGDWNAVYRADYSGYQVASDMTTDVMWCNWGWESDEFYYHQWTGTTGGVQTKFWDMYAGYNFLSTARNTIRRMEASEVADSQKAQYLGEAHALRGWYALFMYDLFGPVPVATDEILDDPETFVYLGRPTDEEWDNLMETDLRAAIDLLPEQPAARGRMGKGAARMLLLKYYMIRGYFEKAETLCRELYAMEGIYGLQNDYASVFSIENAANNEVILQICGNISASSCVNYMTAECLPGDMVWTDTSEGWGGYVMPWAFYDSFEPGDTRKACLYDSYVNKSGETVTRAKMANGAVVLKYAKDAAMLGSQTGNDLVIYRWSDVLLTLAELINRNNGAPTAEAYALVNKVRARAGLGNMSTAHNHDSFNEALLLERGHEFYFEGLRRQDLIRFGKYIEYANARIDEANAAGNSFYHVDNSHNRFPIPQDFINESRGKITQNPGY